MMACYGFFKTVIEELIFLYINLIPVKTDTNFVEQLYLNTHLIYMYIHTYVHTYIVCECVYIIHIYKYMYNSGDFYYLLIIRSYIRNTQ